MGPVETGLVHQTTCTTRTAGTCKRRTTDTRKWHDHSCGPAGQQHLPDRKIKFDPLGLIIFMLSYPPQLYFFGSVHVNNLVCMCRPVDLVWVCPFAWYLLCLGTLQQRMIGPGHSFDLVCNTELPSPKHMYMFPPITVPHMLRLMTSEIWCK